jgi:hypothetical protein
MKDVDVSSFSHGGALKAYIMVQDAYMLEIGTVPGYVFLLDVKECKIGLLTRLKASMFKFYAEYFQVCFHIFYLITDNQMRII